jgi:hypothetical protein
VVLPLPVPVPGETVASPLNAVPPSGGVVGLVVPIPSDESTPASKSKLPASPLLFADELQLGYGVEPPKPPGALATSGGAVEELHPSAHPTRIITATADFITPFPCTT